MRKIMKWALLVVATLPIHVVLVLAIIGVPKPPTITAEGIGRVAWTPVSRALERLLCRARPAGNDPSMPSGGVVLTPRISLSAGALGL